MISQSSGLWQYLSQPQQALVEQGYFLVEDVKTHVPAFRISDYSFLVFPFAKAYEGFLKKLFLDLGIIKRWQYEDDHFRIGKSLSPFMQKRLKQNSVYLRLTQLTGNSAFADELWRVWREGRNQIFHYFPHNIKAITMGEAETIIQALIAAMEHGVNIYYEYEANGAQKKFQHATLNKYG
ncbi:TPA: hypothetical protein DIV55_02810 [Patescibacteria group bacterium]|uniref:Bacterial toxin RNase RnlA/LsoA DBD domain-containing protein n=1 Tax=Candidatus Gottesmanbacteria bacterium GW2011_GWA1_43_11 TaxID=1618436 RepID=A0A0G1CGI6_9BACT|nr:MAG: hypothetical protein UV59_C0012G0028 [Candidatus Gottesmanbacteria bacterium GW2011_GWA1_43_11]HCS78651.1 hypothetical protein [Patescibacteria group bacterium]